MERSEAKNHNPATRPPRFRADKRPGELKSRPLRAVPVQPPKATRFAYLVSVIQHRSTVWEPIAVYTNRQAAERFIAAKEFEYRGVGIRRVPLTDDKPTRSLG